MARSCARRSLAAETIFMALVICRVFLTERMRRLRSSTFAIYQLLGRNHHRLALVLACLEILLVIVDGIRQAL